MKPKQARLAQSALSAQAPSYIECVARTLAEAPGPVSVEQLVAAVSAERPVGKGARSAVYRALGKLYQAVPVAAGRYGWLAHLLAGATVRHPLTHEEAQRGYLMLDELEHAVFAPQFFQTHRGDGSSLVIKLVNGPTISGHAYIERKTWSLGLGGDFVRWVEDMGGQGRDSIIIHVEDAAAGVYVLRLQPREARDETLIQHRNMELALLAEETIAEDRRSRAGMPPWELAARLVARGFYDDPIPPDDLHFVLHHFSLLHYSAGSGYSLQTPAVDASAEPRESRTANHVGAAPQASSDSFAWPADQDEFTADDLLWLGPGGDMHEEEDVWSYDDDDVCEGYGEYLELFEQAGNNGKPLSHRDYHLLEAELEYLVALETEFGALLDEQSVRKSELANRLFIDPDTFLDDYDDVSDMSDFEDPPFWQN